MGSTRQAGSDGNAGQRRVGKVAGVDLLCGKKLLSGSTGPSLVGRNGGRKCEESGDGELRSLRMATTFMAGDSSSRRAGARQSGTLWPPNSVGHDPAPSEATDQALPMGAACWGGIGPSALVRNQARVLGVLVGCVDRKYRRGLFDNNASRAIIREPHSANTARGPRIMA